MDYNRIMWIVVFWSLDNRANKTTVDIVLVTIRFHENSPWGEGDCVAVQLIWQLWRASCFTFTVKMGDIFEERINLKFCMKHGKTCGELCTMLKVTYGDVMQSFQMVWDVQKQ
jgi:hypothetical protein